MKIFGIFLLLFGIIGCSSRPSENNMKYKRIITDKEDGYNPSFFYGPYKPSVSRVPASVAKSPADTDRLSAKETYFLGMWQQKLRMEKVLGEKSNKVCPAFHNLLLSADKEFKKDGFVPERHVSLEKNWNEILKTGNLLANPILSLPADGEKDAYAIYKNGGRVEQKAIESAFRGFYKNTLREVRELCDTGSSPGYFVYENMVRFYSQDANFMRSEKAVSALLKVEPVANYYVLKTMSNPGFEAGKFEAMALDKLNARWFDSYVESAKSSEGRKISSAGGPF